MTTYDLVVVGATPAANVAVVAAAQMHARVAWVPGKALVADPLLLLREGSRSFERVRGLAGDWLLWTDALEAAYCAGQSPSVVQSYGVEYIEGRIRCDKGDWSVGERRLRSRAYLLALDPEEMLPSIQGIDRPQVWTISHLWNTLRAGDRPWPQSIAVWGNGPQAVELSQSLQRLGISVLSIAGDSRLLPKEDGDVAFLLQSYLEGDGIQMAGRGALKSIQPSQQDSLLLEVGDEKYVADALVIATEGSWRLPAILEPLDLAQTAQGIAVNAALQTSDPRIYAIGSLLGGYALPSIARHEAKLAVQNALFERRSPVPYHHLPYAILSDPPLARVGLTETQARRYDPQVRVLRADFRDCDRARFDRSPVGLCKVLACKDGTLLGAHLLGEAAAELIHVFALAMQQGIRLQALGQLGYVSGTFAEAIRHITDRWWQQQHRRDRNERWFYNRRQKIR